MPHTETARAVLRLAVSALALLFFVLLVWSAASSAPDLAVSGFFYRPGEGFYLGNDPFFAFLHFLATTGARIFAFLLALSTALAVLRKSFLGLEARGWAFLLLGLLIGPGLVANLGFKDHWGRARPSQTIEFGGAAHYSPPLIPVSECAHNCSFVSGDGAFGFYLPAFAYVATPKKSRRVFWGTMLLGALFGLSRIAAGAHYFSDTLFALLLMQAILAFLHGAVVGKGGTKRRWQHWFFRLPAPGSNS